MESDRKRLKQDVFLTIEQLTSSSQVFQVFQVFNESHSLARVTINIAGSLHVRIDGIEGNIATVDVMPKESCLLTKLIVSQRSHIKHRFTCHLLDPPEDSVTGRELQGVHFNLAKLAKICEETLGKRDINTCADDVFKHSACDHFVDPYFVPGPSSVAHEEEGRMVHWRRPSEFFEGEYKVFQGQIEPNDIKQGELLDCWLMCTLASLAERPSLVKRLFKSEEVSPCGLYRIRFCKNGEWQVVTVDDYFPCAPFGKPKFNRSNGNELWVMLVEKAYAKLHGDYFRLEYGSEREGMIDLTGCPTLWYDLKCKEVKELIMADLLWPLLKQFDQDAAVISASTPGKDKYSENRPVDKQGGLVPGHAYSVIQVREAMGHRLLNIRNPWGDLEWAGSWSDQSPLWTEEMKAAIQPVLEENDGTFWMNYADFLEHFQGVTVCLVKPFFEARYKGLFECVYEEDCCYTYSRHYFTLETNARTRLYIGLHQEDRRILGVPAKRPNLDLALMVFEQKEGNLRYFKRKEHTVDRQIELEIELKPGRKYVILPYSSGCHMHTADEGAAEPLTEDNSLFRSTLLDLFNKATYFMTGYMSFAEMRDLMVEIGVELEASDFQGCLEHYSSSLEGLTREGFVNLMVARTRERGEVRAR